MNKQQRALLESIEHWGRMIIWADTQSPFGPALLITMRNAIGELWTADYCPLCKSNLAQHSDDRQSYYDCLGCILHRHGQSCDGAGLWQAVNSSKTWSEWVHNALIFQQALVAVLLEDTKKARKKGNRNA